jgi:uncharacterized protein
MNTVMSRIGDWFARTLPTREQMAQNRYVPKSALRAELWRFTRRSVPRGVALGIIVGVLLPVAQIVLTTFLTNPFTTPLLWALSYQVGRWILRIDAQTVQGPLDSFMSITDFYSLLHWLEDEGKILVFGLAVIAVIMAAVGYLASSFAWRCMILRKRRRRISL